jgi:serine protease
MGSYIVSVKQNSTLLSVSSINASLPALSGSSQSRVIRKMGLKSYWVVQLPANSEASFNLMKSRLMASGHFASVEPNVRLYRLETVPNDPAYATGQSFYLGPFSATPGTSNFASHAFTEAWDTTQGSADIRVAVMDTGIQSHPDLALKVLPGLDLLPASISHDGNGRDLDATDLGDYITQEMVNTVPECEGSSTSLSSWHGTAVASVISAISGNNEGVSGADRNAKIVPIRVLGSCYGEVADLIDGMLWASGEQIFDDNPTNPQPMQNIANPVDVINLSLGADGISCTNFMALRSAINTVTSKNIVIVAAAGNSGLSANSFPANCPGMISAGAATPDGRKTFYSHFGGNNIISAQGGDGGVFNIKAASNEGTKEPTAPNYREEVGTSFSAPLVASAISLMKAIKRDINNTQALQILRDTARPFTTGAICTPQNTENCTCRNDSTCSLGILNAKGAIEFTKGLVTAPVINTGGSKTATAGEPIILDGNNTQTQSGKTIVSVDWMTVSGPNSTQPVKLDARRAQFTPDATGEYIIEATAMDSAGQSSKAQVSIVSQSATTSGGTGGSTTTGGDASSGTAGGTTGGTTTGSETSTPPTPSTPTSGGTTTDSGTPAPSTPPPSPDVTTPSSSTLVSSGGGGGGGSFGWLGLTFLLSGLSLLRKSNQSKVSV